MRTRIAEVSAVVLLTAAVLAGWGGMGTATAAGDRASTPGSGPPARVSLGPGQALAPGGALVSADGQVEVAMQADGNLVGYAVVDGGSRVLWAAGTEGDAGARTVMQADGNLVVYSPAGSALWSSGTAGHPGAVATVQDDGNTVVYGPDGAALWSTGTPLDFVGPGVTSSLGPGGHLRSGAFLESSNGRYRLYETPEGAPGLYQRGTDGLWWLMEGSDSLATVPGVPTFFSCALCTEAGSVVPGSFLTLQDDGNLVLSPPGRGPAEWSAGVAGDGGVSLRLQDDGNLVLYRAPDATGGETAAWQTGTDRFRGTVLGEGVTLGAGQFVLSPDGGFELVMQADGNLVVYGAGLTGALWASGTGGGRGASLTMQDDGNLVVYGPSSTGAIRPAATGTSGPGGAETAEWASGTGGPGAGPDVAYATVAAPYVGWLSEATAAQAQVAAAQAGAAAGAYEAALAATVPPPLVAANRAQLASLVATNLLGQNAPAIAATEAQYAEMWAQDAAALYGYAAGSSTASPVPVAVLDHAS